jgi:hypothetical protein
VCDAIAAAAAAYSCTVHQTVGAVGGVTQACSNAQVCELLVIALCVRDCVVLQHPARHLSVCEVGCDSMRVTGFWGFGISCTVSRLRGHGEWCIGLVVCGITATPAVDVCPGAGRLWCGTLPAAEI